MRVAVVGGGVFGLTGALALAERGHTVTVFDPGPIPHPIAASTDINKLVRADYGADLVYVELMEAALGRWHAWNDALPRPLFHRSGWIGLSSTRADPDSYVGSSFSTLLRRGHEIERLDADAIAERFPRWADGGYVDGYFNPRAGWVESGAVVAALADWAREAGVAVREGAGARALATEGERVVGVTLDDGRDHAADVVVVAAGVWSPRLIPELAGRVAAVGQPSWSLAPADRAAFAPPRFTAWAADIATRGWYGFPVNGDGIVKVANHGAGIPMDADGPREVPAELERALARFLAARVPDLADAPIVGRRLCLYCDSVDGDFWIDAVPGRPGLAVATGGSGHGFKFAPVLGDLVADAAERAGGAGGEAASEAARRFSWRSAASERREAARATTAPEE